MAHAQAHGFLDEWGRRSRTASPWCFTTIGSPPLALGVAGYLVWGGALHWQDTAVFAITHTLTGLGITVGFHRLFTPAASKTSRGLRVVFAIVGAMAVEGPMIEWGRDPPQAPPVLGSRRRSAQSPP